jgi:hypothetical protein
MTVLDRPPDTITPSASRVPPHPPVRSARPLRDWVLERGVLYVLTGTPIIAIIGGLFYRILPYRFLLVFVLAAFVILPIWTSYRRRVSTNPDEPAHHLHKYGLWALAPAAMFSVSRIPLHYAFGIIYWHPWYDFGNALTGTPLGRPDTLLVGGILNLLQGWAMGLGFYILFKRHSLINALLYIAVWISGLYSFDFATYSRVGLKSPPYWHASMAWAHFWMALTLWFMARFAARTWPRLALPGRAGSVAVLALIVLIPSVFAQWRAATWEFPRETRIDTAAFNRAGLVLIPGTLTRRPASTDAQYGFTLRFGPRDYRNWFNQTRSLDAGSITVTARLSGQGQTLAWCTANVDRLPSANGVTRPQDFPAVMKTLTYTDIPVLCNGPAPPAASAQVTLDWTTQMTLIGGREQQRRQYTGNETIPLTAT